MNEIISLIIGIIIGVAIGVPLGMFLGGRTVNLNLRTFAGFMVMILWGTAIVLSFVRPGFVVDLALHGVAGGIVATLFGEEYFKNK
jgi:hypothetical protein